MKLVLYSSIKNGHQARPVLRAPHTARCSRLPCHASQKGDKTSFYRLLEVSPNSSRAEIRAAYIGKIRTMHPDISTDEDATSDAVALNAAYAALMEMNLSRADGDDDDFLDVFDITEAEPDMLFVNPFACQVDPLRWQELQAYAVSAPPDSLLEDHLMQAGISVRSSAIVWLTPAQLLEVEKELEQMEMTFSFETTAWWLSDVLARARITNNRMPQSSANFW